ncbi:MAG TPA: hypothetical protein PLE99_05990 [Candidatus Thiothrix moscowensis]|uniref:hypothetical protein n=1 Tax=unclassified Thiothrix TaxID=2636184 RepID=UPI0025DDECF6|nr:MULTISPECIES: hypothetical protein [unclassified Thiothrix]HRJ52296.1 hypothetical protein [Candidatus Thiothrix moscowensis]HRJ92611.1 hypothetical protein [Candidatus Thiothrix moscowensis]
MWRVATIMFAGSLLAVQNQYPAAAALMAKLVQNTTTAAVRDDAAYFEDAIAQGTTLAASLVDALSADEFESLASLLEGMAVSAAPDTVATLPDAKAGIAGSAAPVDPKARDFLPRLNAAQLVQLQKVIRYTGGTDFTTAITGMAGPAQHAFYAMVVEYHHKTGKKLNVGSVYRSAAYQVGVKAQFGADAAEPGWSQHQHGYSVDIDRQGRSSPQVAELHRLGLLVKHGFVKDNPSGEAWHIEHQASYSRFGKDMLAYCARLSLKGMDGFAIHRHIAMAGMFSDAAIIKRVEAVGKQHGLPRGYMATMLKIESALGQHMLNASGASGWYQLMPAIATAYGVKNTMDLSQSTAATAQLARDNKRGMVSTMPVEGAYLYMAHQQGLPVVLAIWRLSQGQSAGMKESTVINSMGYNLPGSVRDHYFNTGSITAKDGRQRPYYTLKSGLSAAAVAKVFLSHWQGKYNGFETTIQKVFAKDMAEVWG